MKRLIEKMVFVGFVTCCRRAGAPTSRCPSFVNATTDGVVRPPSAFGMTVGSPPSRTAMHEFVVPRSMPIVLAMRVLPPMRKSRISLYVRYGAALRDDKAIDTFRRVLSTGLMRLSRGFWSHRAAGTRYAYGIVSEMRR